MPALGSCPVTGVPGDGAREDCWRTGTLEAGLDCGYDVTSTTFDFSAMVNIILAEAGTYNEGPFMTRRRS